jgi:hypothetical protein
MKVIAGAMGLVVALTLTVAAGAFAQMAPQGKSSTNNVTTNNTNNSPDSTSTDPTPLPSTPTTPAAPAADCPSEIEGMNAVLTALPIADRNALGGTGQLPDIPCAGYHYAADFTIVPDTPAPSTPAASQPQQPTPTGTQPT